MGLLQKACETYDAMAYRAGQIYEGETEPLAPVSHIMARAHIEITLNQDGISVSASTVSKEETRIIIPVTEESAGRTSAPCAHPLCDQLGYVSPYDAKKQALYISLLSDWINSEYTHPKLQPILSYVRGGSILDDLSKLKIIELTSNGDPKDEKLMVYWVVNGLGEGLNGPCWKDRTLMNAFTLFVNDASAARPEGSIEVVKLYWFRHNCKDGQYSSAKVHRSVQAELVTFDTLPHLRGGLSNHDRHLDRTGTGDFRWFLMKKIGYSCQVYSILSFATASGR